MLFLVLAFTAVGTVSVAWLQHIGDPSGGETTSGRV
jgi:hypothetical protein